MKIFSIIALLSTVAIFTSCTKEKKTLPKKEVVYPVNKLKPIPQKISKKTTLITTAVITDLREKAKADPKNTFPVKENIHIIPQMYSPQAATEKSPVDIRKRTDENLMTFVNLRKILSLTKIGQTLTQDELTENFKIPEDAVKLVKTVTKTAENELAVKWQSTWFVEKVSDAELEDGRMKVIFKSNKMYTSGKAIGIKYNKKIYNNLVIIGRSAYIPSVKGYSWQIGR